jgi:hypothetical protein
MMKRTLFIFLVALVCFSAAQAQSQTPAAAAQSFYRWYVAELNAEHDPITKNRAEMRKRVSARLAKWFGSKAYEEYDSDYFLDAQDYDEGWAKTAIAAPGKTTGNTATVTVTLPKTSNFPRKVLNLTMIREAGAWKIDKVKGR